MGQVTITADYSADSDIGTKDAAASDFVGFGASTNFRMVQRFPLAALPSAASVSKIELIFEIDFAGSGSDCRVGPYNANGQADPSADDATTLYSRCNVPGSGDDLYTTFGVTGTGVFTLNLTTPVVKADLLAAKLAVDRFSLGYRRATEGVSHFFASLSGDDDPTNPPKLRITYGNSPGLFWNIV